MVPTAEHRPAGLQDVVRTLEEFVTDPQTQATVSTFLQGSVCSSLPADFAQMCKQARTRGGWDAGPAGQKSWKARTGNSCNENHKHLLPWIEQQRMGASVAAKRRVCPPAASALGNGTADQAGKLTVIHHLPLLAA